MSLADDRFLPTGTYSIINAEYNQSIAFSEQDECLSTSSAGDYGWTVTFLKNKKWIIQGPSGIFVHLAPDVEEGDDVISMKNPPQPHQWVIKRHPEVAQAYRIYSPTQSQLFWSLANGDQGATPQLSADDGRSSLWKFKKVETVVPSLEATEDLVPAAVHRPTQLKSGIKNRFAVTIPPGWLTTITSVSCGSRCNLIRIRHTVDGALETQDLVSGWDAADKVMTLDGSDSDSLALPSTEYHYALVVDAFNSKNPARKDPRKLPTYKDSSTNHLRVFTTSRPNDMKSFPDYQTFTIFDESLDVSGSGQTHNAIITIHTSVKVAVDLNEPGKPDPETVNKGYNEELDCHRPSYMDQWLEKYRVVFVVDDSSAMAINGAWAKARGALIQIAAEAMQYDANGIDLYFLNSLFHREGITAREEVVQIFGQIIPQGPSPIGARLESVLNEIIAQLEQAKQNTSDYGQIKPINIVVLTNSSPSDNATKVIRSAVRKLNEGLHHPNAVGIQFVQIGNDNHVEKVLKRLCEDPSFSIVDIVSFGTKFTPENLQKAVLGATHPSVRAKVASSSGRCLLYYRLYNKDGAIATKRPAYLNDVYLGRILSKWVAPPHHAGSLRHCLSTMENIDHNKTRLFAGPSSESALTDDTPVSLNISQTLGLIPEEPLALFSEVVPQDGLKPGTESLQVPPDAQSPLAPRFLYYGVYTEGGASASKKPVDPQEAWVSRIDLDLVPPPLSVASLMKSITINEGLIGSSQIFVDKDTMTPLKDDHVLTEDGNWLGSTADDHIMFKFNSNNEFTALKFDGSKYGIQNCATGMVMALSTTWSSQARNLDLHIWTENYITMATYECNLHFTFKPQDGGGVAFRVKQNGYWAGPNFRVSAVPHTYYFFGSKSEKDSFFICSEPDPSQAFYDTGSNLHGNIYEIAWKNFDANDRRQMWRLLPVQ